jgi:hypothetical protein
VPHHEATLAKDITGALNDVLCSSIPSKDVPTPSTLPLAGFNALLKFTAQTNRSSAFSGNINNMKYLRAREIGSTRKVLERVGAPYILVSTTRLEGKV